MNLTFHCKQHIKPRYKKNIIQKRTKTNHIPWRRLCLFFTKSGWALMRRLYSGTYFFISFPIVFPFDNLMLFLLNGVPFRIVLSFDWINFSYYVLFRFVHFTSAPVRIITPLNYQWRLLVSTNQKKTIKSHAYCHSFIINHFFFNIYIMGKHISLDTKLTISAIYAYHAENIFRN